MVATSLGGESSGKRSSMRVTIPALGVALERASELLPLLGTVALSFAVGAWTIWPRKRSLLNAFLFWALGVIAAFVVGPAMTWVLFVLVALLRAS